MPQNHRIQSLIQSLDERILVLDGAMGTAIQALDLKEEDFGGAEYFGCNEYLVLTRPHFIEAIHQKYCDVGADIIETNTFGGTKLVLNEFNLGHLAHEINVKATQLAKKIAEKNSTPEKPRFVAGSIGPTTKALSVTGGITFNELIQEFYQQAKSLYEGGVDYFLLETCQDTRNVKAGLLALRKFFDQGHERIPIAVSCTIEPMGTMLAGQSIDSLATALEHEDLLYIGLNCATGPEFMTDHIRTLSGLCKTRVACVPNAGLPDEDGNYLETPKAMSEALEDFCKHGWINLLGGCCGTTHEHIRAFSEMAPGFSPRKPVEHHISTLSGIECLEVTDEKRPVLVGERTNVIGSRKFKRLICEGAFEEASEIARAQVKKGAHIMDVCMANPDRDELQDMDVFMSIVMNKVKVPFMIDSTDHEVLERALTYCQGKSVINSINLEDGEERFEKVVPLAKKYGAALVVGCIDEDPEQGMGVTRERKIEIAKRSFDLLTKKYGVAPQDLYFDPLVFPCATGDEQYIGSAAETIEGVRLIKETFPLCKTVLGISNVSFGLPEQGREVLNSVFLYHCTKAGLDLAIVNSEKLERYASISESEKRLAENLLWNKTPGCIQEFADYFREAKPKAKKNNQELPLEKRLPQYILEGTKDGLVEDLNLALNNRSPLEIINGPLMDGMTEVGRLFNNNELIVAEVLQSAEAMKAAVSHLESFMEKKDMGVKAKVLLATVKGDVHDIGKNLVDIILSNNGFEVINLGIKITPEKLIEGIRSNQPDIVGLSGLLVKSAQQMVVTAEDLSHAKIDIPMLVGGAALSRNFVDKRISPSYCGLVEYAKDAMCGLDLVRRILDEGGLDALKKNLAERRLNLKNEAKKGDTAKLVVPKQEVEIERVEDFPKPPDYDRHILTQVPPDQIWPYVNPLMLYGKHLGMKGSVIKKILTKETGPKTAEIEKAEEIFSIVDEVKAFLRQGKLNPRAMYRFFPAASRGDELLIFETMDAKEPINAFQFPRQKRGEEGLCLSDFVAPLGSGEIRDSVCFFVVSAGEGILEMSAYFKEEGEFLKSHALQAIALETAEGFAEYLHAKIRSQWGFADSPEMTMMERFQAKYRGCRYSFGYPACPDLSDQEKLFQLIEPIDIGIHLTEGHMMDPGASVSALVLHHPQAQYFSI